jgi:hypothetical protein
MKNDIKELLKQWKDSKIQDVEIEKAIDAYIDEIKINVFNDTIEKCNDDPFAYLDMDTILDTVRRKYS